MNKIIQVLQMFFYAFKTPKIIEMKKGYKRYEYNPKTGKVRMLIADEHGFSFESKDCLYGNARSSYEFKNLLKTKGYKVR